MTFEKYVLHSYKEFETPEPVGLGDGRTVTALGTGKAKVISQIQHGKNVVEWMTDVLYVPKLTNNLFSVHAAALQGNVISFSHEFCWIRNKKRKLIGTGSPMVKLYKLNCVVPSSLGDNATVAGEKEGGSKVDLWHQRLAHVNLRQLHQLVNNSEGIDMQLENKLEFL